VSATAIVWLVIALAWLVVLALIAPQALQAVREAMRLRRRVSVYAKLPVIAAARQAVQDAQRLERAAGEAEPLLLRAQEAIAVIRRGPLPPEVVNAFVRVRDEVAAFRRFRVG
jgi:hypothetical protein